ncbi:MAG: NADH-quinone oxidoreductase subunit L [Gammaproteobacteria bacterium]|nr:NADH-quinone oxidoreductase subunit L [Gammaproteobacteria bacterium]MYF53868.1 NADH-quinone oxidoreductase subunit L [Gammaproteobacteria bacterium]MYK42895.1 NADH-quinone oxidoreductase subunit L [Gammaproteobacteria bacterium]
MTSLWLIPALPLAGFLILVLTEGRLPRSVVAWIGAGSVGIAAVITGYVAWQFLAHDNATIVSSEWLWFSVGSMEISFRLWIDELSLVMTGVITGVGFLIHWYATGYMSEEEGYSRFFAYMNLFVFAMLMLVMGDSLLLLFLGWEGVGLCSYLLIGFFHKVPEFGYAARKAFVVTRVGDTFFLIALFLIFWQVGTLDVQEGLAFARANWDESTTVNTIICLLLLGGAVGKSAQIPLQTWLPDAMAGPTPVSALIHAATMVTAGVYLIARMQGMFELSELAMLCVTLVGLATLFIASFTALVQSDIKRVLAFSTMSQIGYMFFALGLGAWSAGFFHLVTHAFFKALLFLASGSVILAMHHEQDMFKMGGLRKILPVPYYAMLIGSAALAALPLTAGFFSKDAILLGAWDEPNYGGLFWTGAIVAAVLTSLYTVRMIALTFWGEPRGKTYEISADSLWNPNRVRTVMPFLILGVLSIFGGWIGFEFTKQLFNETEAPHGLLYVIQHLDFVPVLTFLIPLLGIVLGILFFRLSEDDQFRKGITDNSLSGILSKYWHSGWGFDWVYDRFIVWPFVTIARTRTNKNDIVDLIFKTLKFFASLFHHILSMLQTGHIRWYAFTMFGGILIVLVLVMWV